MKKILLVMMALLTMTTAMAQPSDRKAPKKMTPSCRKSGRSQDASQTRRCKGHHPGRAGMEHFHSPTGA